MAYRWNATIATQTDVFRGTSTVDISENNTAFPLNRTIRGAVYAVRVEGGVSGSFGVSVIGRVGNIAGSTVPLAGQSAISTAGTYILFPYGYSVGGAAGLGVLTNVVDILQRIDQIVPPSHVAFQSGVATAGISANCTVSACLWAE